MCFAPLHISHFGIDLAMRELLTFIRFISHNGYGPRAEGRFAGEFRAGNRRVEFEFDHAFADQGSAFPARVQHRGQRLSAESSYF